MDWLQQILVNSWNSFLDAYLEPSRTSEMKIFAKRPILDVWFGIPLWLPKGLMNRKLSKTCQFFTSFKFWWHQLIFTNFSLIKVLKKKQDITSIVFFRLLYIQLCFSNIHCLLFECRLIFAPFILFGFSVNERNPVPIRLRAVFSELNISKLYFQC